jgi:aryl-alcohol dehydrogenase-like predicted oxidoreductase
VIEEKRKLGRSEILISPVGIGTAPIGSTREWYVYWGPQEEADSVRAIHTAIDLGVNWIDTAPFYGWGKAEDIVGRALKGKRDQVFIFTKCGTLRSPDGRAFENLSPRNIRNEVDASLKRLETDRVDLYQFHDPDPRTPIEESWGVMQELVREGKVRYGGLSNHPPDLVERAMTVGPVIAHQHRYNLLEREIEGDILPFSERKNIGLLAWSPLASGFLVDEFDPAGLDPDDFRRQHPYAQEPGLSKLKELRAELKVIAVSHGKRLMDLAVAWTLRHPAVTGAIMGIRSEKEAREMLGGIGWKLTGTELSAIGRQLASANTPSA